MDLFLQSSFQQVGYLNDLKFLMDVVTNLCLRHQQQHQVFVWLSQIPIHYLVLNLVLFEEIFIQVLEALEENYFLLKILNFIDFLPKIKIQFPCLRDCLIENPVQFIFLFFVREEEFFQNNKIKPNMKNQKFFFQFLMVYFMLLLHNIFHPRLSKQSKDIQISLLDLLSKIQIIDLMSIDKAIIQYQEKQDILYYNSEIAYFIRFLSVYNNINQNLKEFIVLGTFTLQLILLLQTVYQLNIKEQNASLLSFMQYYVVLFCLFIQVPFLSINLEFLTRKSCSTILCKNDNSITLYIMAVLNILVGITLQAVQIFFGRSDNIQDNNLYNQLQLSIFQQYIQKVLQLFIIIIANLTQNPILIFVSVIAFIIVSHLNSFYSLNMNHYYQTVQLLSLVLAICYYLQIQMLQFLIIILISDSVSKSLHNYLVCNLLTSQNQAKINIVALSHQINHNPFYKFLLIANHNSKRCTDIHQISQCILKRIQQQNKYDKQINLLYCNQIAKQKPLKALIHILRHFKQCSLYYKIAYEFTINYLLTLIRKKQEQFEQQDKKFIDVNQVRLTTQFQEETIREFCSIIDLQIKLWQGLMQGYQNYNEYIQQIKFLSQKLLDIKGLIKVRTQQDNLNVIQLRVLQIYSSVIYLNPRLVFEYDKDIEEKLREDRFRMDQNINNQILNEGEFLILQTSLIENVGQIIQFDKLKYRQYFNLKNDYVLDDQQYIDNFIPPFLRQLHPKFINNFIRKGFSQYDKQGLNSFMLEPSGYIQNINIQINQNFSIVDDLVISSIISKNQMVNKFILISEVGQILGMDQQSFELIKQQTKSQITSIKNLVNQGVWIQVFMKHISRYLSDVAKLLQGQNYIKNFNNIVDNWIIPINIYKNLKFYHSLASSSANSQVYEFEDRLNLLQQFEETSNQDVMFNEGQQLNYNLEIIQHNYKDGCYSYFKISILDEEIEQFKNTIKDSSSGEFQLKKQLFTEEIIQDNSSDQIEIQNLQSLPAQNCKFLQALSPVNISQKLLDDINQEHYEIKQTDRIEFITLDQDLKEDHLLKQKTQKKQLKAKTKNLVIKQKDDTSLHSSQASYQKEHDLIIHKIQDDEYIIKPLLRISILLFVVQILLLIIIIVNVLQVQSNITNQLNQIELIRKPQDISYVMTSLITQYYFKLLNYQKVIVQSPFINYWNDVQLDYMNNQIYTVMQPQSLDASLLAQRFDIYNFTKRSISNNSLVKLDVPLNQIYQEFIQNFLILYSDVRQNDYRMTTIRSEGILRQNILRLTQLHSLFIDEIDIYITDQQLSVLNTYILFMVIQIMILVITFAVQLFWWQEYDKLVVEFILILNRLSFQQADNQVMKLQTALKLLQESNQKWMQSTLQDLVFNTKFQQTQIKQLISQLPSENYLTKWNIVVFLILMVINQLFNLTGFIIYQSKNESFQPSLLSMVNYVQFLHDFDCAIMDGAFIKLDGMILDNNISNINQTNAILAFNEIFVRLQPQLNEFVNFIYSTTLQDNPQFSELLYQDLCQLSTSWLIMCKVEKINQTYWDKDQYSDIIGQGILGYTGQLIKYIKQEYYLELQTYQYDRNKTRLNETINSKLFQNFFLQYFLDMQEILRQFFKVFLNQNREKGLNIIQLINGYFNGFGTFYLLLMSYIYYRWIKYNQFQMILMRQVIGIIPAFQNSLPHYRAQIKKLYKRLY
ncbi:hypothetical protein pb186bvf_005039 [Paramecium bursaria]